MTIWAIQEHHNENDYIIRCTDRNTWEHFNDSRLPEASGILEAWVLRHFESASFLSDLSSWRHYERRCPFFDPCNAFFNAQGGGKERAAFGAGRFEQGCHHIRSSLYRSLVYVSLIEVVLQAQSAKASVAPEITEVFHSVLQVKLSVLLHTIERYHA